MAKVDKTTKKHGITGWLDEQQKRFDLTREWKWEAISTGILALDNVTTRGGLPRGLLIDLYGDEGLGKTTLVLSMMAERVRRGELCVFVDVEHRLQPDLVETIIPGCTVDPDTGRVTQEDDLFRLFEPGLGEEVFMLVDRLIAEPKVKMIALDSVAALKFEEDMQEDKYTSPIGLLARRIGAFSRRILDPVYKYGPLVVFVNQMRMAQNSYGPMFKSSTGGKAIRFLSSLRINMMTDQLIKTGDVITGQRVKLRIEKNSIGAPQRETRISIMYGQGIDLVRDLVDTGTEAGLISQSGGWYKMDWKGKEISAHGEQELVDKLTPHLHELRAHLQQVVADRAVALREEMRKAREEKNVKEKAGREKEA